MSQLSEILKIVNADENTVYDDLITIQDPKNCDKDAMGEHFEAAIGWDPTTHYDREAIKDICEDLANRNDLPEDVANLLIDSKDDVVDDVYSRFESDGRDEALLSIIYDIIEERTGFSIREDDDEDDLEDTDDM